MSASATRRLFSPEFLQLHIPGNGHVQDVSGHGRHGTWSASEAYADNPYGHAGMDFSGTNLVSVTDPVDNSYDTAQFSMCAWTIIDALDNKNICGRYTNVSGQAGMRLNWRATGAIWCQYGIAGGTTVSGNSTSTFTTGVPVFVVGTRDATSINLYINGVLEDADATAIVNGTDSAFKIGGRTEGQGELLNGKVWGVRLYSCALTGDEVAALYEYDTR